MWTWRVHGREASVDGLWVVMSRAHDSRPNITIRYDTIGEFNNQRQCPSASCRRHAESCPVHCTLFVGCILHTVGWVFWPVKAVGRIVTTGRMSECIAVVESVVDHRDSSSVGQGSTHIDSVWCGNVVWYDKGCCSCSGQVGWLWVVSVSERSDN